MASYRSPSPDRYRSPSPSSKRRKHRHYEERASRSRSGSRDRSHRHRSSTTHRHSSHRSSRRYDDRYDDRHDDRYDDRRTTSHRERSTRHHDNVSTESRSQAHHPSAQNDTKDTATDAASGTPADASQPATKSIDKDELARQRKEKIEKWKREQALKKAAEDEAKAAQQKAEQEEAAKKAAEERAEREAKAKEEAAQAQEAAAQEKAKAVDDTTLAKPAKEVADVKEQNVQDKPQQDIQMEEVTEESGKKWSLEDDDEDDEDTMEYEMSDQTQDDAERSFKPLSKAADKEDDGLVAKQLQPQRSLFSSNKSNQAEKAKQKTVVNLKPTKPKTMMRIGLGKSAAKKRTVTPMDATPSAPAKPKPEAKTAAEDTNSAGMDVDEGEVDPLEAYMMDVTAEARKINEEDKKRMQEMKDQTESRANLDEEEALPEPVDNEDEYGSDPEDILALAAKKAKKKDLAVVDHSQIDYEPFRKNFYIEPPELKEMTSDQVDMLRIELDGIKIRGVNCPKPIQKWTHCGLPAGCLEVIRKLKFERPTSIQAQAIPAIMSGRDVIGVAKTGSGKTIAFLLPMFRHIKDQRPLEMGEGPIAIIMTPTRELATQIHRECKPFLKVLGLKAVCAYGGSPIKDQIADLKRGCEIIVCTPGRMIDLLCANSGRVTNLQRVTYLVLDEADRMFDMGFEPQVMKIVNNVRPKKQTVLFSATFPRQMEALARKVLKKPLEITVGGRSVVCSDVEQHVEVREDSTKFIRLLEILGQFFNDEGDEDARALIFVDRHEAADNLLRDLIRRGYPCQSLHGGKDQVDRDSTIADFKSGVSNILIATSVAARGLDVKQLKLVVNYECPNHMEDYVHRVGRTGRAGNKGTAYTFITSDQDRYALDICKALKLSGQEPPPDLQGLADQFQEKVKAGKERMASSGFGGKGLERLDKDRDLVKRIQKRAYGGEDMEESDEEEIELESRVVSGTGKKDEATPAPASAPGATASTPTEGTKASDPVSAAAEAAKKAAAEVAARINGMLGSSKARSAHDVMSDINARFNQSAVQMQADDKKEEGRPVYAEEIVINDYPQKARWRVTNKEQISQITEVSGAAITTRGTFFPPGKQPGPNERKLYLFIEGDSELVVEKAKTEIKRILVEATVAQMEAEARTGGGGAGRYTVL